jgi:transposase
LSFPKKVDILKESKSQENEFMSNKPRRQFTQEQKAEAVQIVRHSGKPISQIAKEMGLTESALRKWVKQAQTDQAKAPNGPLTTEERQELAKLRRDNKRLQMERDFLKKAAAFFAAENSSPMS